MDVKELLKQLIPSGVGAYSVRRHEYIRLGIDARRANWIALSTRQHENLRNARLNLVPKRILWPLSTCVDAGAHAGGWTDALLNHFRPERIIAVECEPRLVESLKNKFSLTSSITVVDAALAGSEGMATFHQLRHPAGSSLLKPRAEITTQFLDNSWDVIGTAQVRKVTYDQLVANEREISILKLDIQGAEMDMLTASHEGLEKTKCIILEVTFTPHYEDDSGFPELHQLMASKGFGLYRLSAPYDRGARILYADAVYVREEILRSLVPDR